MILAFVRRLGMNRMTGRIGEHRGAAVVAEFEWEAMRMRHGANHAKAPQRALDFLHRVFLVVAQ